MIRVPFQKGMPDTCLATIEAIYYAIREHQDACDRLLSEEDRKLVYDGRYDNLLFWFEYFRSKVDAGKASDDAQTAPSD